MMLTGNSIFLLFLSPVSRLPSYVPHPPRPTNRLLHVSHRTSCFRPATTGTTRLLFADKVPAVDAVSPAELDLSLAFRTAGEGLVLAAVGTKVNWSAGGKTPAAEAASKPRLRPRRRIRIRFSRHSWRSWDDRNRVWAHSRGTQRLEGDHVASTLDFASRHRRWGVEVDILGWRKRFVGIRTQGVSEWFGFQLQFRVGIGADQVEIWIGAG